MVKRVVSVGDLDKHGEAEVGATRLLAALALLLHDVLAQRLH